MIARISQSKRFKRISVTAATVVLGVGLCLSMSSFDDPGSGEGGDGLRNHISDIDPCQYKCSVGVGPWELTWEQDGHLTECHSSAGNSCTEAPCTPAAACNFM